MENLQKIPKVELHNHLELSIRHSTIQELAPNIGIDASTRDLLEKHFLIMEPMKDLGSVLNKFLDTQKLFTSTEIIERVTYEVCEDAYNMGTRILELRYAPTFLVDGHPISFIQAQEAIMKGIKKAEKDFPIAVGVICILQRTLDHKKAEEVCDFALANKEMFIGFDLADNEEGFDSKPFTPLFHKAKDAGLGITVHSGEANLPNAPRYVKEAIDHLGATRIGHGVQIYRDPSIMEYVKSKNVVLELCPTSNWLTQAVETTKAHPIRQIMEAGVLVTLNTDDAGIFNIDIVSEYELLQKEHSFTNEEFNRCNDIAASASFIDHEKKQKVWPRTITQTT